MTTTTEPALSTPRRALDLLSTFDADRRRQTLTEMARRSGLPVATTYRLAAVLTEWGALSRGADRRYEIGRRVWELGLLADVQTELRALAAPFLQDLFVATREPTYLAVRTGTRALYVDRLVGADAPQLHASIGSRLPMHATAVGKVLLSAAPAEVVAAVARDLRRFTTATLGDEATLRRELVTVAQLGYARTREELGVGHASVAVPVAGPDGRVVAALGVVTGELRHDLSRSVPALRVAAQGITRTLTRQDPVR